MGGRRGCVIVVFLLILCPLLMIMALFADTLNTFTLMVMLACMGILIGGPNNIVTSAVAADLAEHPSISGSKSALGTVVGLINGSGSFVAAMGQMAVPLITDALGWSALWYFMLCSTVISCLLMIPKIKQELAGEEAEWRRRRTRGRLRDDQRTAEQKASGRPLSLPSPLTTWHR